jgi:nucleotide-binding universal stress UspA family protein
VITLKRILVPHDFSETSAAAVTYARGLAAGFHAELDVLHVIPELAVGDDVGAAATAYQRLRTTIAPPRGQAFCIARHVRSGTPHAEIGRFATERDENLIVMGTHGRGFVGHALMGSVAERVIRTAPCPVLTVRGPRQPVVSNILVAFDFEQASDTALTYARTLARTLGARLHVLHVVESCFLRPVVSDPYALVAAARWRVCDRLTDEDSRLLHAAVSVDVSDVPAEAIVRYAMDSAIDLIVMGTHGRQGARRLLLGSIAERIVRTAPCPVLTVRHPERESVCVNGEETAAASEWVGLA